jgi:hypothetical protein
MFHKIQDGDIFKLMPQISKENGILWIREMDCLFIENSNTVLYDVDSKWMNKLKSIIYKDKYNSTSPINSSNNKVNYSKRYYCNFIDKTGSIKTFTFGKGLHKIIVEHLPDKLANIRSNYQLHISLEIKMSYPVYDKSSVIEAGWFCPVNDLNDQQEWMDFIKNNSPDLDTYFRQKDIKYHTNELSKVFGNDVISEIISSERSEKLNQLGI